MFVSRIFNLNFSHSLSLFVIISRHTNTYTLANISACSLAHAHLLSTNVISCAEILRPGIGYSMIKKPHSATAYNIYVYELSESKWMWALQHPLEYTNTNKYAHIHILANRLEWRLLQHSNRHYVCVYVSFCFHDFLYFIWFSLGAILLLLENNACCLKLNSLRHTEL